MSTTYWKQHIPISTDALTLDRSTLPCYKWEQENNITCKTWYGVLKEIYLIILALNYFHANRFSCRDINLICLIHTKLGLWKSSKSNLKVIDINMSWPCRMTLEAPIVHSLLKMDFRENFTWSSISSAFWLQDLLRKAFYMQLRFMLQKKEEKNWVGLIFNFLLYIFRK